MGHSQFDDASRERTAWNAGKKVGTKRPELMGWMPPSPGIV